MQLTLHTKLSYGFGAFGKDFAILIVYLQLLYYYTDVLGVSAAFVGVVFLVARIWDAVNDPVMGWLVTNTRSRWGQFKPWIFIGTLLFWSLVPRLAISKEEREQLVPYPRFFADVAWILTAAFALKAVDFLGGGDRAQGFQMFSLVLIACFVISTLVVLINVKERLSVDNSDDSQQGKLSLREIIFLIKNNDQLLSLLGMALAHNIAMNLVTSFAIYYFTYVVGSEDLFPYYLGVAGIAKLITLLCFSRLAKLLSRQVLWLGSCVAPVLSGILLIVIAAYAPQNIILISTAGVLVNIGISSNLGGKSRFGVCRFLYWCTIGYSELCAKRGSNAGNHYRHEMDNDWFADFFLNRGDRALSAVL